MAPIPTPPEMHPDAAAHVLASTRHCSERWTLPSPDILRASASCFSQSTVFTVFSDVEQRSDSRVHAASSVMAVGAGVAGGATGAVVADTAAAAATDWTGDGDAALAGVSSPRPR